ncbi:MAG: HPr family phosphocarrier protein [Planctomycetes bacterium]|nr:HPr family phosphocarrier protein [Planctomycetota bacterium]
MAVTLENRNGLHARPAHMFVQTANAYSADLSVSRPGEDPVNGKSIMGIMMLAAEHGTTLNLTASGADAEQMLSALKELVARKFDEE